MAKFLYAYSGGSAGATDEERNASMQKWQQWMGGLGAALVDGGAPFAGSKSVKGGPSSNLSGYSIVEASSLDDAVGKAKDCPIFENGGNVEVYEAIAM